MFFDVDNFKKDYAVLKYLIIFLLISLGILTIFLWLAYFEVSSSFDIGSIFFKSTYLILTISSFLIVLKINIRTLVLGRIFVTYSSLDSLLTELKNTPDLSRFYIEGEMITLSLLFIGMGFYFAVLEDKNTEEKLKKSEEKYHQIFESSPELIVFLDKKGNLITVNKRFTDWLGYKIDNFLGKNIKEFVFISSKSRAKAIKNFLNRVDGKDISPYEIELLDKNKRKFFGMFSATVVKNKEGEALGDLVMISDITRRKRIEKEIKNLKELDKTKDEFLNVAAHEFKSPLSSIIGMGQILEKSKNKLSSEQKGYLKVIIKESLRLNWVVKQILTVTRFETGKAVIEREVFDLEEFLDFLIPSLEPLGTRNNSKIKLTKTGKKLKIAADKSRISSVMYNLVENAVKYGKDDQIIEIKLSKLKNDVKVEVIDQGEGVPIQFQDKLFVKFGQLENYLRRAHEGIGLGLYICKIVINKMGGEIGFKNNEIQGSNFYFSLPLKK
ncbi:PAS domain S-box protein [bacterium]|nr:PAS domain S-box protein [bacterium]